MKLEENRVVWPKELVNYPTLSDGSFLPIKFKKDDCYEDNRDLV